MSAPSADGYKQNEPRRQVIVNGRLVEAGERMETINAEAARRRTLQNDS